ncbi:hypothetical protein Vadar_021023 [Vaccinium darrowii]|uniref:Uncharacterized protein n=1 Tax=Vaccinium darrowii TaxID=229202 RepID=A0ACB7Z693_9ERIC|nr:hypothetical protein Vadar_021023 [Vaccinium darrowii]
MDLETNGVGSFLRRHSSSSSNAITPIDDDRDDIMGNGSVVPIPANALATTSFVSPSTLELIPPLSTEAIIHSDDKNQENKRELPWVLDCSSHLIHLAVFGILGVLTRYLLQKLFGPGVIGLTSDQSVLYLDLPSNMFNSCS